MSLIERRRFLSAVSALVVAPLAAWAQRAKTTVRVAAILTTSPVAEMAGADPKHPMIRSFVHELRALGYVQGENLILERRSLGGHSGYRMNSARPTLNGEPRVVRCG